MAPATPPTSVAPNRRWILLSTSIVTALAIACALLLVSAAFAPRSPNTTTEQSGLKDIGPSIEEIDHSAWDALLQRYVNAAGLVDYGCWKNSSVDVAALDAYLSHLSHADLKRDASREARLAFWINAYNALTIRGILRDYPTTSPHDELMPPKEFNLQLPFGKSMFSLDRIEDDVLRPLNEPQIHFAIVCGSRGCPQLMNRAYTARGVTAQLNENAMQFFADPSKFSASGDSEVKVSPILQWYADDFGKTPTEVLKTIAPYMPAELRTKLLGQRELRIRYLDYDRTLNDQAVTSQPPLPPEPITGDESQSPN